jgi:exo-beta-1,3-glucanase (GH17 family)
VAKSTSSFTVARLYSTSDCDSLANAVPAALQVGMQLLVGLWLEDETHYTAEKLALINVLSQHPNWQNWIYAVSVGSEDLYRGQMTATTVAQKINDVKGPLTQKGVTAPVGHVDSVWYVVRSIGRAFKPIYEFRKYPDYAEVVYASGFIGIDRVSCKAKFFDLLLTSKTVPFL